MNVSSPGASLGWIWFTVWEEGLATSEPSSSQQRRNAADTGQLPTLQFLDLIRLDDRTVRTGVHNRV